MKCYVAILFINRDVVAWSGLGYNTHKEKNVAML